MAKVLDWHGTIDQREVIQEAARVLAEGQLVAFPTETVYGIAADALNADAVERLSAGKGRPEGKPLALAIHSPREAGSWVPEMSALGKRLSRRLWPGPCTLVFDAAAVDGLPERVRCLISPIGTLGLRVPAHEAILQVLGQLAGPLVLTSANRSGAPAAVTADEVVEAVGDEVALVIDDGPCRYGQASTVVKINGNEWQILREGVLSAAEIERQTARLILFVCTGNTCRSPLAEGVCKKLLAEQLGCTPEDLPQRGFVVLSAGLAAIMGAGAAAEAVEVAREHGVDLSGHVSRPLTQGLVTQADYVIGMTRAHLLALAGQQVNSGTVFRLLSDDGQDLSDPIGSDRLVYQQCAEQITHHLQKLLPELQQ